MVETLIVGYFNKFMNKIYAEQSEAGNNLTK